MSVNPTSSGGDGTSSQDIMGLFRTLVWTKNMAVPVAAMNALVMKIKVSAHTRWLLSIVVLYY